MVEFERALRVACFLGAVHIYIKGPFLLLFSEFVSTSCSKRYFKPYHCDDNVIYEQPLIPRFFENSLL